MSYGLDIHPAVIAGNIRAATPPSPRKHKRHGVGIAGSICLLLLALVVFVFGYPAAAGKTNSPTSASVGFSSEVN